MSSHSHQVFNLDAEAIRIDAAGDAAEDFFLARGATSRWCRLTACEVLDERTSRGSNG